MQLRTTVLDLYKAKCTLWVEDELTRLVLTEFWQDTDIHVVTAGGSHGVRALVGGAPRKARGRAVIGLVDRDFSLDNRDGWRNPDVHVLRLPAHEFESLLLDFDVLSALSRGTPTAEIKLDAASFVVTHRWWMACKQALHEMRSAVGAHFPEDPALDELNQDDAVEFIKRSSFWQLHREALRTWTPEYVKERVTRIAEDYLPDTVAENWPSNFSGKELFRHLRATFAGLRAYAQGKTAEENDENLGVVFARRLREPRFQSASPTAKILLELRAALRDRAGLSP